MTPMRDATATQRASRRKTGLLCGVLVILWLVSSAMLSARSYERSDALTVADVTLRTDEGLISLQIPYVRLARTGKATVEWTIYTRKRGVGVWESGNSVRSTLRRWMSDFCDTDQPSAGMIGEFGYWTGSWWSDSRPGPFIVVFAPIWAATMAVTVLAALFIVQRFRFKLRSILVMTALAGVLLWILTLRAET